MCHPVHLNTPRAVTNQVQQLVWRWENQEPFGNNPPEENPSGIGNFEFPLRFPGTYAYRETGTLYNWHRDLDPATSRYVQSDPIGLDGGINPYAYAGQSPLMSTDPEGLCDVTCRNAFRAAGLNPESKRIAPSTVTITKAGVCSPGDPMCAISMRAAGLQGPFYGESKEYDVDCLATFGLVAKVGGSAVGNALARETASGLERAGASARTMSVVQRGVALYTHPGTVAVFLTAALPAVLDKCEIKACK